MDIDKQFKNLTIFLYLSSLNLSKTQYILDRLSTFHFQDSLSFWQRVLFEKDNLKKVYILKQTEGLPSWLDWPKEISLDSWREFITRSNRLSVEAYILSQILDYSHLEIAQFYEITEGGIEIAVADGALRLGEINYRLQFRAEV